MRPTKTVDQLVYEAIQAQSKKPESIEHNERGERSERSEYATFASFLQRHLIPEVRQETHAFYGHLDTQEAKYPGLDYNHPTHRIRLSRWRWHRKLFHAFETLHLTNHEISSLTHWEGTKWAKEKYEREQNIKIRDTTADGIPNATDIPDWYPTKSSSNPTSGVDTPSAHDSESRDSMDIESEDEMESVGVELNERLRAQAARREAGETDAVLDEEWEQWLKTAIESGQLDFLTDEVFRRNNEFPSRSANIFPSSMRSAARSGNWSEIPEFLQPILRRTFEPSNPSRNRTPTSRARTTRSSGNAVVLGDNAGFPSLTQVFPTMTPSAPPEGRTIHYTLEDDGPRIGLPYPRRTYSDLRLPGGDLGPGQLATEASGV